MDKDFFLIIDGSSLLSTQFFGNLPREITFAKTLEEKEMYFYKIMQTKAGVYTNAVYGFLRTLFSIIERQKPAYVAVTWDLTRNTFRREMYEAYKANRSETLVPLKDQFALCQEVLKRINIPVFMDEHYEADDFSGSLSTKFGPQVPVRILTKDHDYLQLVNDNVKLWLLVNDQAKADEYYKKNNRNRQEVNVPDKVMELGIEDVKSEFGIYPNEVPSLKGLMGDSADNICGVKGVGEKTAVSLIAHYGSVEALYKDVEAGTKESLAAKWKEIGISRSPYVYLTKESEDELVGKKAAILSEKLATIVTDLELSCSLEDLKYKLDVKECLKVLKELEISSLVVPASEEDVEDDFTNSYKEKLLEINDFQSFFDNKDTIISECKDKTIGLSMTHSDGYIDSLGIYTGNNLYYIVQEGFILSNMLEELLTEVINAAAKVVGYDLKQYFGKLLGKEFDDVALIYYLLNPIAKEQSALEICGYFNNLTNADNNAGFSAYVALYYYDKLYKELERKQMDSLYRDIEKPLIEVLYSMEQAGIVCKKEELVKQGQALKESLKGLEEAIYDKAGEKFNILSPKQLGVILFEKLGLPGGKKTKTGGYKTDVDVLTNLKEYPIVDDILKYRQLSKLLSTYIEGLDKCIRSDGRIHPTFNQMITATGRLSCVEPNLQNIPVREDLGRKIRKAFVPADGCVFVDADYSQIELRILAHMANDQSLISDYKNARDVHQATASKVFNIPYEEVTKKQRSNAKAVNFGIVYGISSFGLGNDLDISTSEAKKYIEAYFKQYPGIKKFLDDTVEGCKKNEYVKTLYGRIRPVPEIASATFMQRSFGERVAMNSPIQGTAADIMKIAMLRVYKALKDAKLKARILLQIHDEILIECPKEETDTVKALLEREMSNAAELKVKLEVSSAVADNWYDLK